MSLCTTIFWYLVVSFIHWDILWVENIPSYEPALRVAMFLMILIKFLIDFILWIPLNEGLKKEGKL